MIDLIELNKDLDNGSNMGGVAQIYVGYHADVETWPTEPVSPTSLETLATLTGDVLMKAGKRMFPLYATDDTADFKIVPVGELDGKSFEMQLSLFHPGLKKKILGFMNATKNENLVFVVVDNEGQQFLMGSKLKPSIYNSSPDANGTGKATKDRRGLSFEFLFKCKNIYAYPGSIPLTPAES